MAAQKRKTRAKVRAKPGRKRVTRRAAVKKRKRVTATDTALAIIRRSRKGVNTATVKEKTRFSDSKVRTIIYRLK